MDKAIGGYFELELRCGNHYHKNAIRLNTARNCFEYILLARKYKKVYIPYYTCEVMLQPLRKHHIEYEFYSINFDFEPVEIKQLQKDEAFLYTNYFGLKQNCVEKLSCIYKSQLIVDNAQAFFAPRIEGIDTFYSPRKFVGVPDGAYLYTDCLLNIKLNKDASYNRMQHLLCRVDNGAEEGYQFFIQNDNLLNDNPIMLMSNLSSKLLCNIDYSFVRNKRLQNYNFLDRHLKKDNCFHFNLTNDDIPMVYPYYNYDENGKKWKDYLIKNKIFIATYWPNIFKFCNEDTLEYRIADSCLFLPIDQRYESKDMLTIIKEIKR